MTTDAKVPILPLLGLSRLADKSALQAAPLEAKLKMGVLPSHHVCTFIWGCHPHLSQCCETFGKKTQVWVSRSLQIREGRRCACLRWRNG